MFHDAQRDGVAVTPKAVYVRGDQDNVLCVELGDAAAAVARVRRGSDAEAEEGVGGPVPGRLDRRSWASRLSKLLHSDVSKSHYVTSEYTRTALARVCGAAAGPLLLCPDPSPGAVACATAVRDNALLRAVGLLRHLSAMHAFGRALRDPVTVAAARCAAHVASMEQADNAVAAHDGGLTFTLPCQVVWRRSSNPLVHCWLLASCGRCGLATTSLPFRCRRR